MHLQQSMIGFDFKSQSNPLDCKYNTKETPKLDAQIIHLKPTSLMELLKGSLGFAAVLCIQVWKHKRLMQIQNITFQYGMLVPEYV